MAALVSINYDDVPTYEMLRRFHVREAAPVGVIEISLDGYMLMTIRFSGYYNEQIGFELHSLSVDEINPVGKIYNWSDITKIIMKEYPKDSLVKPSELREVILDAIGIEDA